MSKIGQCSCIWLLLFVLLFFELVAVLYYLLVFMYLFWILLTLGHPLNIIFYSVKSDHLLIQFFFFFNSWPPLWSSLSSYPFWTAYSLDLLTGFQFETSFPTILEISWTSPVLDCFLSFFFMVYLFQWSMFSKLFKERGPIVFFF